VSPRASKLVVVVALAMAPPASAQAAVLHDQTSPVGFHEISSNRFTTPPTIDDSQVADDFTVPAGQSWTLTQVDVVGDDLPFMGMSAPPIVNVFIYSNAGTLPGSEVYRYFGLGTRNYPNQSAIFEFPRPPPLNPGTYWISVQDDGGSFMVPSWYWFTRSAQDGNQAAFQGTGGGWGSNCATWKPITTCPGPISEPDMAWKISGSADSLPVTFGKLKRLRNGTAKLLVDVQGSGTLTLTGKRVKESSAQVAARKAASTITLPIRATGKARKALNAKGKVTVHAKVTYSASGATPATTTKKVKLRKG
jgi:hypothetical protein